MISNLIKLSQFGKKFKCLFFLNKVRDTNYFTNWWYDEWLLVDEKWY